jgi:hypothetical protein
MRWEGQVALTGKRRIVYKLLVGKRKGMRALERPRRRWERKVTVDHMGMGWYELD